MKVQDVIDDLYELLNNLEDDLELSEDEGIDYQQSHEAVIMYTLQLLNEKIVKWKKKLRNSSK